MLGMVMETINEAPKKRGGRKRGSFKPLEYRHVKIGFSVPPHVARALEERVAPGERSRFIEQLIAEKFGL